MRIINKIIIHCSATKEGEYFDREDIKVWHLARGFKDIGYHYVILLDGTIQHGRDIEKIGAHCTGYNKDSIGICYIGGLDKEGKPKDTRTKSQKIAISRLLEELKEQFPIAIIKGHRDFSPDINKDGKIDPWEWSKSCPCFDVSKEY